MDELFALLIPLGCGCVLPILVIWLTIRKEMNETNTRTKIVLAAIEKNPDMNIEELIEKISPKKKLLKETLLEKLMWGWICAILGPGLIGLGIYLKIEGMGRPFRCGLAGCRHRFPRQLLYGQKDAGQRNRGRRETSNHSTGIDRDPRSIHSPCRA